MEEAQKAKEQPENGVSNGNNVVASNSAIQSSTSVASISALSNSSTSNSTTSALAEMRVRVKESASRCEDPGRSFLRNALGLNPEKSSQTVGDKDVSPSQDPDEVFLKVQELQGRICAPISPNVSSLIRLLGHFNTSHSDALVFIFQQLKDELNNKIQVMDESSLGLFLKETIAFLSFKELRVIPLTVLRRMSRIPPVYLRLLVEKNMINEFSWPIRRQAWENNNDLFIKSIEEQCATFVHNELLRNESFKQLHEKIGPSEILFRSFASYCVSGYLKDRSNQWGRLLTNMVIHLNESGQQIKSLTKLHELASMIDRCRRQGKIDVVALKSIRETVKGLILAQATYEEKLHKIELDKYYASLPPSKANVASRIAHSSSNNSSVFVERKVLMSAWRFLTEKDTLKLFAQPVTEAIAPKYFDFIKNPMDLSTMKKKIEKEKYNTLQDFHVDAELMLENCKVYNTPASDLGKYAEKLQRIWRDKYSSLLREHQGKDSSASNKSSGEEPIKQLKAEESQVKEKAKPSTPASVSEVNNVDKSSRQNGEQEKEKEKEKERAKEQLIKLKALLNEAYEFLLNRDHSKIFVEKVTDRIAPDYSKHVKTPMYLNLIKSKLKSGAYDSLQSFDHDARLMFDNCVLYNGDGSYFGVYAMGLKRDWEGKFNSLIKQLSSSAASTTVTSTAAPLPAPAPKTSSIESPKLVTKVKVDEERPSKAQLIGPVLWEEWQYVTYLDGLDVFAAEVDLIGYRDYIKEPMDLGTMKQRLSSGFYRSIEDFHRDIALMIENCITFNSKEDPFGQYAILLRKWWQGSKEYFMKKASLVDQDVNALNRLPANWDGKQLKTLKTWSTEERKSLETLISMETPDAKRGANLAMLQTVLKICIDFLMTVDSHQFFFKAPDDFIAPNYSKVIDKPMAISICQNKVARNVYKSLDNLHDDVVLIMRNCFKYNGTDSDYSKSALALAAKWYLFYLAVRAKFPFLSIRKEGITIKGETAKESEEVSDVAGTKRKFNGGEGTSTNSAVKKSKNSDTAAKPSSSQSANEPPLASEYRDQADEFLKDSKEGYYSSFVLLALSKDDASKDETSDAPQQRERIQLASFLGFKDLQEVWQRQSQQNLQNLFTYLIRHLSRLDESKFFSRPMQQQIQNSKVISDLMDLTTMKIKVDRNSYRTLASFHDDVTLMIRNCFMQFLHEEKNPAKKLPPPAVDTKQAAKTAQKLHYAWNIIYQNLEAVFSNDPSKAVTTDSKPVEKVKEEEKAVKVEEKEEAVKVEEVASSSAAVVMDVESKEEKESNEPKEEDKSTAMDVVPAEESESVSDNQQTSKQANTEKTDKSGEESEAKSHSVPPIPKESQLLKSSLEAKKQLFAAASSQGSEHESANTAASLTELPAVLTTTAFTWTILMLTEPQLQYFFARFLAIMLWKQLREKIQSPQSNEHVAQMILGQDKLFRFLSQLCQLMLLKELNLAAVEEVPMRYYLPSLLVYSANSSATGPVTPADKEFIEETMRKFPLSPESSSLDPSALKLFLEKLLHHLRVVKSKYVDQQPSTSK